MSAMSLLVESTVKMSLIVLMALAATALLRKRPAALRHWILSAAIACAAAVPVMGLVLPSWHVPFNTMSSPRLVAPPDQSVTTGGTPQQHLSGPVREDVFAPTATVTAGRLLAAIWTAGAGGNLLILFVGLARLARIASRARRLPHGRLTALAADISRQYGLRRSVLLLQSDHPTLMVTWGLVRPKVILPRDAQQWTDDRARVVLCHELAHIQRGDWLVQMAAELLRSVYWFNPLAWIVCRRLRQESEHATDDAVLNSGVDAPEYAKHLLDLARAVRHHRQTWLPAPAIARSSSLERRISAMLNARVNRAPTTRSARLVTVAASLGLAVAVASAQGPFATFSGSVVDPMNGLLPDARLILTNLQSGAKHEVRSDRTGRFEFVGLPRGDYSLDVTLPGFATLKGQLSLTGQNVQQDINLRVGSLQETITVVGQPGVEDNKPLVGSSSKGYQLREARRLKREQTPCAGVQPGNIGGNLRPPMKLKDVRPRYPRHLKDAGIAGVVVMSARIGTDGAVNDVEVVTPAHPDFDAAAIEAVRQWEFDETLLNCAPVEVSMKVTVNFKIKE
jgi:TonB family protein